MNTRSVLQKEVKKRELFAWALYDFANSGYTTVVLTTVFSAYFVGVIAAQHSAATLLFTATMSTSYLLLMLTLPQLGAWADKTINKKRVLLFSTSICVIATALLAKSGAGTIGWAMVFLLISNYAYGVGEAVIAAFLPEIAKREALGRVSGWGWGFGYFGGMLTLGLALWLVTTAEADGLDASFYVPRVMLLTAGIFAAVAVPALLFLRQRQEPTKARTPVLFWQRLPALYKECRSTYQDLGWLLVCGACYHAGISVVITLSSVYATQEMGFSMSQTMMLIFTVNIAAALGALGFGHVQDRIGHKRALALTLYGWLLMVLVAVLTRSISGFWLAATLAGLCIGSSQSAGRAMVGLLAPAGRLTEMYGLWGVAVQFAAVVGPLAYGLVSWFSGGNHRLALSTTALFFIAGLWVLRKIQFKRGAQAALNEARV